MLWRDRVKKALEAHDIHCPICGGVKFEHFGMTNQAYSVPGVGGHPDSEHIHVVCERCHLELTFSEDLLD